MTACATLRRQKPIPSHGGIATSVQNGDHSGHIAVERIVNREGKAVGKAAVGGIAIGFVVDAGVDAKAFDVCAKAVQKVLTQSLLLDFIKSITIEQIQLGLLAQQDRSTAVHAALMIWVV